MPHLTPEQRLEIEDQITAEVAAGGTPTSAAEKAGRRVCTYLRIAREMRAEGKLEPRPEITDEDLRAAVEALEAHGSQEAAADAIGMARTTFGHRIKLAVRRGVMGERPVPPGFEISKTTTVIGADGKVQREFIQQRPEHGAVFDVPEAHEIKGVSALVDADGRVVQRWIKTREDARHNDLREAILAVFAEYSGPAALPPAPEYTDGDLLTVLPVVDLHLGLYAWAREAGADYDVQIGSDLLRRSVSNLVSRSARSETALILDLGDYFHADSSDNRTKRSGNPLDVDTRYARVLQVGYELVVETVELALQKHSKVVYRKLPGNHDDETSLMLAISIAAHFRNEPRVVVDTDPSRFFMYRFGKVMIAATHGDMLRMGDMAGFMATNWPREWGETEYRYGYTGHIHHEKSKVANGVKLESFNTLAAKDAWNHGMGFTSPRNAVSITMHKEFGEIDRLTVNLPMLSLVRP